MKKNDKLIGLLISLIFLISVYLYGENNNFRNRFIEINEKDLPLFGSEMTKDKLSMLFKGSDYKGKNFKAKKIVISDCKIETRNVKKADYVKCSKLIPMLIVVQSGKNSSVYYNELSDYIEFDDDKNEIVENTKKLVDTKVDDWIAFHFLMKNIEGKNLNVYFWYDKSQLDNAELNDLLNNEIKKLNSKDEEFKLSGESSKSGINNLQVFPNPIYDGSINISFDLNSDLMVKFEIYDINGNLIKEFKDGYSIANGNNTLKFGIDELIGGVYYLVLKTENNKQSFTKFINIKG